VAATLVTLHVAADAEGLAAARVRALEGLLAGVAVAVDAQGTGTGEGLVASRADVAVLALGEAGSSRRRDVVVVLPGVGTTEHGGSLVVQVVVVARGREGLRKGPLVVEAGNLGLGRRRGLHGRVVGPGDGLLWQVGRGGSGGRGSVGGRLVVSRRVGVVHARDRAVDIGLEGRRRLVVVVVRLVLGHRNLADGSCRGRVVALEGGIGAHGWRRGQTTAHV
jgi:hypothetical protein